MKYNKSKTYLLPLLSEILDFDMSFMKYLINTYMFDSMNNEPNCIGILHDFSFRTPEFIKYEHKLINNDLFLKSYDINNQVMYIFKFPEEYLPEYNALYQGKYSEFGIDAKELILKFWATVYPPNKQMLELIINIKQILYKDEKLRLRLNKELGANISKDQELGSIMDINDETFNVEQMKESV
jgi:hypothetical protein